MTAFLESCLVLSQDQDDQVASTAREALKDYLAASYTLQGFVTPHIVHLMRELLPLAEAPRQELQASLKLIAAYLDLHGTSNDTAKNARVFQSRME